MLPRLDKIVGQCLATDKVCPGWPVPVRGGGMRYRDGLRRPGHPARWERSLLLAIALVGGILFTAPPAQAATPPIHTLSRYMQTANKDTLYNEGCALGTHDKN